MADVERAQRADRPRTFEYVGLSAGSAALLVGAVVTAMLVRGVFVSAHRTFGWIVACAVVALLIDPLVAVVDRHLPRAVAVVAVLLAVLGVLGLVGVGVAREVLDSLDELAVEAPQAAAELEQRYDWAAQMELEQRVTSAVDDLQSRIREGAVAEAADAVPAYLVTAILMLFLLAFGRRYLDGFVAQFSEPRRTTLRHVILSAGRRGRAWLLGSLALAVGAGVTVGTAAWVLDLPAAVSLGVAVGVLSFVPLIGVLVGGVPAALIAFGLGGWWTGAVMAVVLVALQVVEASIVRPTIEHRSLRVGPTVPIVVGLLGFELYGVGGAAYGVALAVIGLAALDAAGQERGDDDVVTESEPATAI